MLESEADTVPGVQITSSRNNMQTFRSYRGTTLQSEINLSSHVTVSQSPISDLQLVNRIHIIRKPSSPFTTFKIRYQYIVRVTDIDENQKIIFVGKESDHSCYNINCRHIKDKGICLNIKKFSYNNQLENFVTFTKTQTSCCGENLDKINGYFIKGKSKIYFGTIQMRWEKGVPKIKILGKNGEEILGVEGDFGTKKICCGRTCCKSDSQGNFYIKKPKSSGEEIYGEIVKIILDSKTTDDNVLYSLDIPKQTKMEERLLLISTTMLIDDIFFAKTSCCC